MMTNQEILTKAIQKAIDNGYSMGSLAWEIRGNAVYFIGNVTEIREDFATFIFNHDFAKALWHLYIDCDCSHEGCNCGCYACTGWERTSNGEVYEWQHHLQQMVLADDPIKYLGEHLQEETLSEIMNSIRKEK